MKRIRRLTAATDGDIGQTREGRLHVALCHLATVEPMIESGMGDVDCLWCGAPIGWLLPYRQGQPDRHPTRHEPDCAWVEAHQALDWPLPAGHEVKDPT